MYGFPQLFYRLHEFWNRPIVKEYRAWFVKNSRIIALVPTLILSLDVRHKQGVIDDLTVENKEIKEELILIKERSIGVFRSFDDIPKPIWSKLKSDPSFIMLRTNNAYYEDILKKLKIEKNDYIGSRDGDIYPPQVAEKFRLEDSMVSATGKEIYTVDSFEDSLGGIKTLMVIKWRKIERRDTLVMGIAIELDPILKELRRYDKNN